MTYDPYQKSIVADKGEIRVGQRYQCEIPLIKVPTNGIATSCDGTNNSDPNSAQTTANEINKNSLTTIF